MARPKGLPKTGGRKAGSTNKSTEQAREAIARFVDANAGRLQGWLDEVANGIKGEPDEDGKVDWLVYPNPVRAFELFQSIIEYHVPKLARTEHSGPDGGDIPIKATVEFVRAGRNPPSPVP